MGAMQPTCQAPRRPELEHRLMKKPEVGFQCQDMSPTPSLSGIDGETEVWRAYRGRRKDWINSGWLVPGPLSGQIS